MGNFEKLNYKEMDGGSQNQETSAPPDLPLQKPETKPGLYDIYKSKDGFFEVTEPGGIYIKKEVFVGTSTMRFGTKEEAERFIEESKARTKELLEKISLEKTFTPFYRIDEIQDGKFRVTLPGLVESKTGNYIGTTHKHFETWQQAKEYFLQKKEIEEGPTKKTLFEIQTSENEKIAFSHLDFFNPQVTPSEETHELPASIEKYLLEGKMGISSAPTYQRTIKEHGWERELYSFISSYLEKEGVAMAKELGVERLESLTPKQAIELATQIVIDLTKYYKGKEKDAKNTRADQSTALQLLKEGRIKKNDPEWGGNGVCRNSASMVKAVFEALKANQTKFSQLYNTYCFFEGSHTAYAPKRRKDSSPIGHAWNTFVTISKGGVANAVVVDVTWGKRNLETKKVEGLDYTLTRMEPTVNAVGRKLQETAPDKEEQLNHILLFYAIKMGIPGDTGGYASPREERQFYATRALGLMVHHDIPRDLPMWIAVTIGREYLKIAGDAGRSEIETLYKLSKNNPGLNFRKIFKKYLGGISLRDDTMTFKNDDLQKMAFEELKSVRGWEEFLKKGSEFRARMREVLPQLFIDFSPITKPEDTAELKYLANQTGLKKYDHLIDPRNPSEEKIKKFFDTARQKLREINPQKYDESFAGFDDYQLVKRFDKISRELKA